MSGRSNVFLLTDGERNILIDTSVSRIWNRILIKLEKLNINNIDYLILTHAHFDHAGNASRIKEKFKPLVIIQKNEAEYLVKGDNVLVNGTNFFTRPIVKIIGEKIFSILKYDSCQYDLMVDSHFDLKSFGFNAYLMHTPGHSIGSMSVIIDDEVAIVGDTMFGIFKWSVFPPYALDAELMIQSWGRLLDTNCSVFIPSHGTANSRLLVQKDYKKRNRKLHRTTQVHIP